MLRDKVSNLILLFAIYTIAYVIAVTYVVNSENWYFYGLITLIVLNHKYLLAYYIAGSVGILGLLNDRVSSVLMPFDKFHFKKRYLIISILILIAIQLIIPLVSPLMGDGVLFFYGYDELTARTNLNLYIKNPFDFSIEIFDGLLKLFEDKTGIQFLIGEWVWRVNSIVGLIIFISLIYYLVKSNTNNEEVILYKIAIVLTLGCMACFTNYIEFIPLRFALFSLYILIYFNSLSQDEPKPWLIIYSTFFMLGYYLAFLPILFAFAYLVWDKRKEIKRNRNIWLSALFSAALLFSLALHFTVGVDKFFLHLLSGHESLSFTSDSSIDTINAISMLHIADVINVMLLQSPFILLMLIISITFPFYYRDMLKDRIYVSLVILTVSFFAEIFLLNSTWGLFADFDIFTYPALLSGLLFLRSVELQDINIGTWRKITTSIIPLSLLSLFFVIYVFHSDDFLKNRLLLNNLFPRNETMSVSNIARYIAESRDLDLSTLNRTKFDSELRKQIIFRLSEFDPSSKILLMGDSARVDSATKNIIIFAGDSFSSLDYINLSKIFVNDKNKYDLYLLRKGESVTRKDELSKRNLNENEVVGDDLLFYNLASYYQRDGKYSAANYYLTFLPDTDLELKSPNFYNQLKLWKNEGILLEVINEIRDNASMQIYTSGVSAYNDGNYELALMELEASRRAGFRNKQIDETINFLYRKVYPN